LIDNELAKSAKKIIKTTSDKKLNLADEREFDFDYVYSDSTTNSEVFEKSVKSNISRALEGYNFSIMAYGQTVVFYLTLSIYLIIYKFILIFRDPEKPILWELIK
jgi:hypothetical protein